MKIRTILSLILILPFLMTAQAQEIPPQATENPTEAKKKSAKAKEKPILTRGWVGGEFKKATGRWLGKDIIPAFPKTLREQQRSAVFVSAVHAETPLADAGIEPGDLITKVDGDPVENVRTFHQAIDARSPGERATLTVFRKGAQVDKMVTIGKEQYKEWKSLRVGLQLSNKLDLIPNPDFSVFSLIEIQSPENRLQLHSPEHSYLQETWAANGHPEILSKRSENGGVWFLVAGSGGHKEILSQQRYAAK